MNKTKIFLISSAFVLTLFVIWSLSGLDVTKIGDILSNPDGFEGKNVRLRGTIDPNTQPFILKGIYKLSDDTGSIWVVTNMGTPAKMTVITVEGKVENSYKFGSMKHGTVVLEEKRD